MAIIPISVTKVSTNASGDQGDKYSFGPVFSGDGTKVLFYSYATNLSAGDTNNKLDVFVKDLSTGEVIRASSNLEGVLANNDSLLPSFSPDGTMVAFHSNASNLVGGDTNNFSDVFVNFQNINEQTFLTILVFHKYF
jgi:Tol biopolymer transport system component